MGQVHVQVINSIINISQGMYIHSNRKESIKYYNYKDISSGSSHLISSLSYKRYTTSLLIAYALSH